jgi:hypothetical protein
MNYQRRLERASNLINSLCDISHGTQELVALQKPINRLTAIIRKHDNQALFSWLMNVLSFQGISDRAAEKYITDHGNADYKSVHARVLAKPACEKLTGFWSFNGCGYEKAKRLCSHRSEIESCPLPELPLRNGRLNQTAFSLYFFMRDVASGDLISLIDRQVDSISKDASPREVHRSLVPAWKGVFGISDKVISMALATLLMSAPRQRKEWKRAGCSLIVVDTLVHNFLHRSGLAKLFGNEHLYGPGCYNKDGCFDVLASVSQLVDARRFNARFSSYFPRFVQLAIWRYAAGPFEICNAKQINDRKRCAVRDCYLRGDCQRVALKPRKQRPF